MSLRYLGQDAPNRQRVTKRVGDAEHLQPRHGTAEDGAGVIACSDTECARSDLGIEHVTSGVVVEAEVDTPQEPRGRRPEHG